MHKDEQARELVASWSDDELRGVTTLLAPQLATGWIPDLADLEAAILAVRTAGQTSPEPARQPRP